MRRSPPRRSKRAEPAARVPGPGSDGATIEGLRQGLCELGSVENQSIAIEYRYGDGPLDRLPRLIRELTALRVDVLIYFTGGLDEVPARAAPR